MLDASLVNGLMESSIGSGIEMAFLLNSDGEVLSSVLADEPVVHEQFGAIASAVANAWRVYARCDLCVNVNNEDENESLEQLLLDIETKKICAMSVGGTWVIGLTAKACIEMGMLKLRVASLQRSLDFLLRPVIASAE